MKKEHHNAAQLYLRSVSRETRWALCGLVALALCLFALSPFLGLSLSLSLPFSLASPSQDPFPVVTDPSLTADPSQAEHEQAIHTTLAHNREYIASRRPAISLALAAEEQRERDGAPLGETAMVFEDDLLAIVSRWPPDDPETPAEFAEKLPHFDFGDAAERKLAERFREREIPFKLYNVSAFDAVAAKWSDVYLRDAFKAMPAARAHAERSKNNHFMFWSYKGLRSAMRGTFSPPTEIVPHMRFDDWLPLARRAERESLSAEREHFYFMAGAEPREHGRTFVSRDLSPFSARENGFFVSSVAANKGIQCRFGMRGVIAEAHYDSGKNMVAMLRGAKRYILTPPSTCAALGVIADTAHPSYRHSVLDWSDAAQAKRHRFERVPAIDTVLRTGEVLYIPSFWFHYIVSLDYSIQCNSRSGFPKGRVGQTEIQKCFHTN